MSIHENTAQTQRRRIFSHLLSKPLDTLTARKELDVMHPAARIMELRRQGHDISTVWVNRVTHTGIIHRVALYVLKVGAAAAAPDHKSIGVHENKTDKE